MVTPASTVSCWYPGTACATPGAVWFSGEISHALVVEASERAARLDLPLVADADAVAATWASVRAADLRAAARSICRPTLVVHGELDDQCPITHGAWLANHIRDAAWLPLASVGHAALGQASAALGSSMKSFLMP
jgi:pimeloyl-ACP methyl ester carboxylesterase